MLIYCIPDKIGWLEEARGVAINSAESGDSTPEVNIEIDMVFQKRSPNDAIAGLVSDYTRCERNLVLSQP